MKRVVIDVSALKNIGKNRKAFEEVPGDLAFLVLDIVWDELSTHGVETRSGSLDPNEIPKWLGTLSRSSKAIEFAEDPFLFEMNENRSARTAPVREVGPMIEIRDRSQLEIPEVKAELDQLLQSHNIAFKFADSLRQPSSAEKAESLRDFLRRKYMSANSKDFYIWLSGFLSNERSIQISRERARESCRRRAKEMGQHLPDHFLPGTDWIWYASEKIQFAYYLWTQAKDVPARKTKANDAFDMKYVSYLGICDGLLSNDHRSGLLRLAWACWPEKRENLLTYSNRKIVHYLPPWEQ